MLTITDIYIALAFAILPALLAFRLGKTLYS